MLDAVLVEPFDGVHVGHAEEGTCGGFEVGVELLEEGRGFGVSEELVDGLADLSKFVS
jgi:hypothetical protein